MDGVTAWLGALCGVRHPSTFVSTLKENDMSYRKITVNDKQYEYVVGKQYTKIKDVGTFRNDRIGTILGYNDQGENKYAVTPAVVKRMIEST